MKPEFRQIRGWLVHFHLLQDDDGIYLIDAGFVGATKRLEAALAELGRTITDIRAIALTHGHLDHTLNVAALKQRSGCRVFAPAGDRDHLAGRHQYRGTSRICGLAEATGRRLLNYQPPEVDHWFEAGEKLNLWGGLEVIPLPGHTAGHSGFLSRENRVLFAGDLFSNFFGRPKLPPPWFNTDSNRARSSLKVAAACDVDQVAINHSHKASGARHLADLQKLASTITARG